MTLQAPIEGCYTSKEEVGGNLAWFEERWKLLQHQAQSTVQHGALGEIEGSEPPRAQCGAVQCTGSA